MIQSEDNSRNFSRKIDRRSGYSNRRVARLQDPRISPQKLGKSSDRVAADTGAICQELAEVKGAIAELRTELNRKIDTVLQYITSLSGGNDS
jgi:hypothetical protein